MAETITPDLCIIGAGLGGLAAAEEARRLGASVALIERGRMGGNYLNTGTVPSKALAAAAAHAQAMRSGAPFGIAAQDEPRVNARKLRDGIDQIIAGLAPRDAVARVEASGAQVIAADARFADPRTVHAGDYHIRARRFVIATGARTIIPAVPGLDAVPYFTFETVFDNTRRLSHLVVIGGSAMALEIAQSYNRLGTQVTVVSEGEPFGEADPELAVVALARLREEGVDIRSHTAVAAIQPRSQGIGVIVSSDGQETMLDVSHILVAGRRAPNVEPLELDKAGIKRSREDGSRLELSPMQVTTNRRVYAVGDAAGPGRAHLATWQGRAAVRHALLRLPVKGDAAGSPRVYFTDPEVAEVGLDERAARARHGVNFRVLRASFADNDRARAARQGHGLAKLIVAADGRVIGAGIVGDRAGELIATLALAVTKGIRAGDLANFLSPHATLSEIVTALGEEFRRNAPVSSLEQRLAQLMRYVP